MGHSEFALFAPSTMGPDASPKFWPPARSGREACVVQCGRCGAGGYRIARAERAIAEEAGLDLAGSASTTATESLPKL